MDNIDLPIWFVIYWVWNFIAFLLVRTDKQYARNQARRIREKTFFRVALLGGAAGVLIGMYVYRHKTLHPSFVIGIPVILLGNLVFMYILL